MARPIKKGLDYFPVDTDIFENIQVRKLKSRYKSLGFLAYFTILCDVYKKEGYFLHISDDYVYDLADRLGDTEEKIQERYILVVKRCKNPISEEFNCINIVENDVNASETGVSVTEMRQRKEKESKVNKNIYYRRNLLWNFSTVQSRYCRLSSSHSVLVSASGERSTCWRATATITPVPMLMCDKVTPQYDRQPPLLFRTKGHSIRRVHDFMLYLKY